jgi:hypothetical protein
LKSTLIGASLGTHRFQRAVFGGRRIDWNQMRRNTNRLQALRFFPCTTFNDRTLEAMRTQASPDLCAESKWLIAFNFKLHTLQLIPSKFTIRGAITCGLSSAS